MLLRWTTLVFVGVLLWKLPAERTVIIYRDAPAPPCAAADVPAPIETVVVNRTLVDEVIAEPHLLLDDARFVPYIERGAPAGYKVYAIRADSLLDSLGFQNGDAVHTVNQIPLRNTGNPAAGWTIETPTDELLVELTRRGRPAKIRILIRDV